MKKLLAVMCALLLGAGCAHATLCGTTTVTTSSPIVDTDGFTWAGASYVANLILPSGTYQATFACTIPANTFSLQYTGTLTAAGNISVALPSNTNLTPVGTQWAITITPKAPAGSVTVVLSVTGGSQSFTTTPAGPRFNASMFNFGYGTVEINTLVPTGALFLNTTSNTEYVYNGAAWQSYNSVVGINSAGNIISNGTFLQDDFCGNTPATTTTVGQLGWDITVVVGGTNPVAAVASVVNHPCLITLTTAATATDGVNVSLGHGVGVLFPGVVTGWQPWQSLQIVEINQITTGSYRIGFGTVDSATAIPTNGVYFRFLNGTDTAINACFDVAGTETCTPTTVVPTAADWLDFSMNSTVAGAVSFTVTDVTTPASSTVTLCAAGCTAAATAPTGVLSPMFNIAETGTSVADVLTVDYFAFNQAVVR